jgi:hypothetical protein
LGYYSCWRNSLKEPSKSISQTKKKKKNIVGFSFGYFYTLVFGNLPRLNDYTTGQFSAANNFFFFFLRLFFSLNESVQLTPNGSCLVKYHRFLILIFCFFIENKFYEINNPGMRAAAAAVADVQDRCIIS